MDTVSCCCYLLQFSNNVIIITKIFYWFGWKIFKSLETKNIWYGAWCDQLGVWWLTEAVYNQCLCTLPGDCTGATIAATLIPTVTEHLDTLDTPAPLPTTTLYNNTTHRPTLSLPPGCICVVNYIVTTVPTQPQHHQSNNSPPHTTQAIYLSTLLIFAAFLYLLHSANATVRIVRKIVLNTYLHFGQHYISHYLNKYPPKCIQPMNKVTHQNPSFKRSCYNSNKWCLKTVFWWRMRGMKRLDGNKIQILFLLWTFIVILCPGKKELWGNNWLIVLFLNNFRLITLSSIILRQGEATFYSVKDILIWGKDILNLSVTVSLLLLVGTLKIISSLPLPRYT